MKKIHLKHQSRVTTRALPLIAVIAALGMGGAAQAAVTIIGSSNFSGGTYTYSYSVTNTGDTFDLAVIDIPIGQGVVISNPTAPTGFQIFSDGSPVNLLTFAEDSDFFTPDTFAPGSTVEFFTFQSTVGPSMVTFSALDANGDTFTGQTISAVPEPSGLMLLAASALPLIAVRRRRNR